MRSEEELQEEEINIMKCYFVQCKSERAREREERNTNKREAHEESEEIKDSLKVFGWIVFAVISFLFFPFRAMLSSPHRSSSVQFNWMSSCCF
jgi:hypothetical protein